MIQKTNIDTLHKEGKSQRVITERCGCLQSALSKHIKCKVDWKEEFGLEKVHKQQEWSQAWEYSQAMLIQTLVRASQGVDWSWSQCIKSHHAQTSSGKGLPSHFWTRDNVRSILPGLWRKNNSVVQSPLFRWKSILHLIWKSRSQSLEEEWRGTESMLLEVQCEVSTVSDDLGCHVICWCWFTVFSEVHSQRSHLPGNFRALHASFC